MLGEVHDVDQEESAENKRNACGPRWRPAASVLGDGDQCSGGEELELNKAVDPGSINWSGRSMGQPCEGCIGRRNAKKR